MADNQSTGYTPLALLFALSLGAALGAGAMHYSMRPRTPQPTRLLKAKKQSGWYTILYDFPPGDPDRKIVRTLGPFPRKLMADQEADYQRAEHNWYTSVRIALKRPDDSEQPPFSRAKRRA